MNEPMASILVPENWQIIYFFRTINNFLKSDYALVNMFHTLFILFIYLFFI